MLFPVTWDSHLLLEQVAGIGVPVLPEFTSETFGFVDVVIDGSGLLGDIAVVGVRDRIDHL